MKSKEFKVQGIRIQGSTFTQNKEVFEDVVRIANVKFKES